MTRPPLPATLADRPPDQPPPLLGKSALITGAAGGIGMAIAQRLAAAGCNVLLNDIKKDELERAVADVAERCSSDVQGMPGDIVKPSDVQRLLTVALERWAGPDILINNAGVLRATRFLEISPREWDLVMDVGLKGAFLCTRAALPPMIDNGWGRVVNISSSAGRSVSTLGGAHYTAAKAGLLGLTRAIATEVASLGVTVNAVCPGLIDTDMVRSHLPPDRRAAYEQSFPVPRLGMPQEVAALVAYLCSTDASYVTGASFDINGGDLMI